MINKYEDQFLSLFLCGLKSYVAYKISNLL